MSKPLWGTTFQAGEFEKLQRELWPDKEPVPLEKAVKDSGAVPPRQPLLKKHTCDVRFPDGVTGECKYERRGPSDHHFRYTHFYRGQDTKLSPFPQVWASYITNDPGSVELRAQDLAIKAYRDAIETERREYFMRATPLAVEVNGVPKRLSDKTRYQTDAKTAKLWSGQYAICCTDELTLRMYGRDVYDTLDKANSMWLRGKFRDGHGSEGKASKFRLVVGCFNRLDRRWELPFFNTLYGATAGSDFRETFPQYLPPHRQPKPYLPANPEDSPKGSQ